MPGLIGGLLALGVPAIAWLEQSVLLLLLVAVVAVASLHHFSGPTNGRVIIDHCHPDRKQIPGVVMPILGLVAAASSFEAKRRICEKTRSFVAVLIGPVFRDPFRPPMVPLCKSVRISASRQSYDHFPFLRTLESGFGLLCLDHACDATSLIMNDMFGN